VDPRNRAVLDAGMLLARETDANAVLLAAPLAEEAEYLRAALGAERRVIAAAPGNGGVRPAREREALALPEVRLRRRGRAKIALLESLAAGLLRPGDRVFVVSGTAVDVACCRDTVALVDLAREDELLGGRPDGILTSLSRACDPASFDALLGLCVQLGHEGKAGRPVGLLATLGDHEAVLARSHPIVLNPFEGHPEEERSILSPMARRALREFAGMDGAFVLRGDGVIVAGGRYLEPVPPEVEVPAGLGARYRAAAGITAVCRCLAFTVSETTGDVRVFGGGRILTTIERSD